MNAYTRISEKGQVVVPKATRDRLGWLPGTDLEVVESGDEVTFRRRRPAKTLTPEQAVARFKSLYTHVGPPVSLEQMNADAQDAAAEANRV